jgi:secondary thiamine-phosphate synthase enzyme
MQKLTVKTEKRTQLIDVTKQVQAAIGERADATAALVFVPHTSAGVTITEFADPLVAEDLEHALQKVVDDDWNWKHVDDSDGPNAPSHVRASLIGTQILVPVTDGTLALGRWQGIFFCEFDGPRDRSMYISTLT